MYLVWSSHNSDSDKYGFLGCAAVYMVVHPLFGRTYWQVCNQQDADSKFFRVAYGLLVACLSVSRRYIPEDSKLYC
jgi:hypothetical protein